MGESHQLFFGLWLVSRIFEEFQHPAIQAKIAKHFGRFFRQIKVHQPIGRMDSIEAVYERMRRVEAFLYLAAQNSFQKSKIKIKKIKTYSG